MAHALTEPLIIMQYLSSITYLLENLALFAYLMTISSILTIHLNYFLMRKSYKRIKQIAEKKITVKVKRNG